MLKTFQFSVTKGNAPVAFHYCVSWRCTSGCVEEKARLWCNKCVSPAVEDNASDVFFGDKSSGGK